jgi:hypothetical protein
MTVIVVMRVAASGRLVTMGVFRVVLSARFRMLAVLVPGVNGHESGSLR